MNLKNAAPLRFDAAENDDKIVGPSCPGNTFIPAHVDVFKGGFIKMGRNKSIPRTRRASIIKLYMPFLKLDQDGNTDLRP